MGANEILEEIKNPRTYKACSAFSVVGGRGLLVIPKASKLIKPQFFLKRRSWGFLCLIELLDYT